MPQYMLLLHENPAVFADVTPEMMQQIIARYRSWSDGLRAQGRIQGGNKLRDEGGRHLQRREGRVTVTDGPYSEGKEVIGGYFIVAADDYEQAVRIAQDCPHMEIGRIEVREVEPT